MPNFELFDRRSRPVSTQPTVAIQKRGNFSLNKAAFEALGKPEAVELLFDRQQRIIGMRPVDPQRRHAYPVRKQQNAASYLVAGNAFTKFYGIPVGTTRRYEPTMIDDILTVDLNKPGEEVVSNRIVQSTDSSTEQDTS